ncbi:MAG: hypothetical protein M3R04_10300, partial [bacterium]|nr:hypothetical protein [bacterium]
MRSLLTSPIQSNVSLLGFRAIVCLVLWATMTVNASAVDTAVGKKLIETGWDSPSAAYVRDHLALVESRDWFNGVTINCADNEGFRSFESKPLTEAAVGLDAFAAINWQSYTDNFIKVFGQ